MRPFARLREQLEPVPGRAQAHDRRNGIVIVAVLVASLAVFFFLSLQRSGTSQFGDRADRVVDAAFLEVGELEVGDAVRVRGVDVGSVRTIDLEDGRRSLVTMNISHPGIDLRRDARAHIYSKLILGGEAYVELDPGSSFAPALGDAAIDVSRTGAQAQFDDMFAPYDRPTRRYQRVIFEQFGRGLSDHSAGNDVIDILRPSLSTVARGFAPLHGRQPGELRRLVANTSRVVRALGKNDDQLAGFIDHAARTFSVFAAHRKPIGQAIDASPAAMDASVRAMQRLQSVLPELDRAVARLRPGARLLAPTMRRLEPALRELSMLLQASRPTLRTLGPTMTALAQAGHEGVPLMRRLKPTLRRVDRRLIPFLREPDPEIGLATYQLVGPTAAAISSAASQFDRNGTYLRFPTFVDERSVGASPCQPFLTDPSADELIRCEALQDILPFP